MKAYIYLAFLGVCFSSFSQVQIGQDIDGLNTSSWLGDSVAISSDGSIVAVGAPGNDINGDADYYQVYENNGNVWTQLGQTIFADDPTTFSGISVSLSADGSILATGSTFTNDPGFTSQVRVFEQQNGNWVQIGDTIIGEFEGFSTIGPRVHLSSDGQIVAMGVARNDDNGENSGHVRVFENQNGNWVQIGQDIQGMTMNDELGFDVCLSSDGNIVGIGAIRDDANGEDSGAVKIFEIQGNTWVQIGDDIMGEAAQDLSGVDLCMSSDGTIVAIGALNNDGNGQNSGHVRVYENESGNWVQLGQDIDGEATGDLAGIGLGLSSDGSMLAIGASNNDDNGQDSGHVRIFENQEGNWIKVGQDIDGEMSGDQSGARLAISVDGNTLAIGARFNDGNGIDSGHLRVFDISNLLSNEDFELFSFELFPNPASTTITIQMSNKNSLIEAFIYNSLGQQIGVYQDAHIDVSDLRKGFYFVEVITGNGKIVQKFLKR